MQASQEQRNQQHRHPIASRSTHQQQGKGQRAKHPGAFDQARFVVHDLQHRGGDHVHRGCVAGHLLAAIHDSR